MKKDLIINNINVYHTYPDASEQHDEKHPGLIVIEEIWGVNAHIREVADRFAHAGFTVLAPEILPKGTLDVLTPEMQNDLFDPEKRDALQPKIREAMAPTMQSEYAGNAITQLKACVDYLLADPHVNGRVAVLGFCFGGTYSFQLAAHDSRIKAAVPLYGHPPAEEQIKNISCPVFALYGEQDTRLMETLPKLKEDMQKNGKSFEVIVYPNVGHAFFNDTNFRTYNKEAAEDAWEKIIAFLKKNLKDNSVSE